MIARIAPNFNRNKVKIISYTTAVFLALAAVMLYGNLINPQPAVAAPGINQTINFQGRLLNDDGTLVANDDYSVQFSLYTVSSAGTNIWTETQTVSTVSGLFRTSLGSVSSLSGVNFNQDELYLGIKVGTDPEMTPRMRFHATPYAFEAKQVNGYSVSGDAGELAFFGSGTVSSDSELYWDSTNKRLGIGDLADSPAGLIDAHKNQNTVSSIIVRNMIGAGNTAAGSALQLVGEGNGGGLYIYAPDHATGRWQDRVVLKADSNSSGVNIEAVTTGQEIRFYAGSSTETMRLTSSGLTLPALTNNGGVLYTNGSGLVAQTGVGSNGQCLQSVGGGTPVWGSCGSGGSSLFTDGGTFTYLTSSTDDFILGGTTVNSGALRMDVSSGMLYLGTDGSLNGGLTFHSVTPGVSASIFTDAEGNLNLFPDSGGTVIVGGGGGNIEMSLTAEGDIFLADKTVAALTGAYSLTDFQFKRNLTGGANNLNGAVISILDNSSSSGTIANDMLYINADPTSGAFTGNLINAAVGGVSQFVVGYNGALTIGSGGNTIVLSSTGITFSGTARPTKSITLSPEFTNSALTANGASNVDGTLIADNTGSSGGWRNYYEWTSTQATLQQYSIAIRVTLPQDFDGWDTNAFSMEYQTGTSSTAENAVSVTVTEETQTTPACDLSTDRASTSWTTTNMTCTGTDFDNGSNDWDEAGETAIITITVKSSSAASAIARVGDITLNYKARF